MAAALEHVRVRDVMHHGILSCTGDARLGEVAGIMARHHVHAVAVKNEGSSRPIGVVSDLDVVAAAARGAEPTAVEATVSEPLGISAEQSLHRAAQLMAEHGVSHLLVLDAASGYPIGIISTLDIAAAYAGTGEAGSAGDV
jgi:CBS domain-containing protein